MTIAVLGLGGAGGNIAAEAAKLNIHTAAINFSQRDLNSTGDAVRYKFKVPGSEGVGHNQALATELMQEHHHMVWQFVQEHFGSPSYKLIFVPFATGGGSGAGIAPILIDFMHHFMEDKVIVAVPILPSTNEAPVRQSNTSAVMAELLKLDVCILPIDNDRVQGGRHTQYKETNERFASLLYDLMAATEKEGKDGNFDRTDLCTLFNQPGFALIGDAEVARVHGGRMDIKPEGIAAAVQASWESSIFTPSSFARVHKAGLVYNGHELLVNEIRADLIFQPFAKPPVGLFEGYYNEDNGGRILTVLAGLAFPRARFDQIDALIETASAHEEEDEPAYVPKTVQAGPTRQRGAQASTGASSKQALTDLLMRHRR